MDYQRTLDIALDQLILALRVRAIFEADLGSFKSRLIDVSLGPYPIELDTADLQRGAWSMEVISIQHLAIALDTYLKNRFPGGLGTGAFQDFRCFVRCLRNAFAHDPYNPVWDLQNVYYRREYAIDSEWKIDLTNRHKCQVQPSDYRYASGLIELVRRARNFAPD